MTDSQQNLPTYKGVPFSFFSSLIREISKLRPSSIETRRKQPEKASSKRAPCNYPALHVFGRWVDKLRKDFSPLPPNTTATCFRLLFPEEDVHRKYNMQERTMAQLLADCLGTDVRSFDRWSLEEASGCLGHEVKGVLSRTCPQEDGFISPLSIGQVDELLDELAAKSGYSHTSIRSKHAKEGRRTRLEVMRSLFRELAPEDASVLTQIILKDLKPLLYPLTEFHYTTALTKFNTAAVKMLTKEHAMNAWDPSRTMSNFYRMHASLEEAAAFADQKVRSINDIKPNAGSPIAIPKSEKGQNCSHALEYLASSPVVWAETKYDGERAQIHVEIRPDGRSHITIYSKSGRDSTHDRYATHEVIRSALGLELEHYRKYGGKVQVTQNVILDAEMVAFRGAKIEEFWHIRQLIGETAHGIRSNRRRSTLDVLHEHESMNSEATDGLRLGLVFFDVLCLNSESLLAQSYKERRRLLEDLIDVEPGRAILANRFRVDMLSKEPDATLCWIFSEHVSSHEEGLVLKAEDSGYNDYKKPWVKLKKDYIPGHGDCVDLVILGASWEKIRGRSLRVPPTAFTTFYVGVLENRIETSLQPPVRPSFHMYFTVSYGLNRDQLEDLNFLVKNSDPIPFSSFKSNKQHPFNLTVLDGLKPTVILQTPLLVELFGAGFTKAGKSHHYELRFPRIAKFHRPSERSWKDAEDVDSLHKIACECVGRDMSDKYTYNEMGKLFDAAVSPGVQCPIKRKDRTQYWFDKLTEAEGKPKRRRPHLDRSPRDISRSCWENNPSSDRKVGPSPRKNTRPLTPRTNIIQSDAVLVPQKPPTSLEHTLRLTTPRLPITPPRSSPLDTGPTEMIETPSSRKRTRSISPPRKFRKTSKTILTITITTTLDLVVYPPNIHLDSTLAYFAKPGGKCCTSYSAWKTKIMRPVHSISALKVGCGWTEDGLNEKSIAKQGLIILDECDKNAEEWKVHILAALEDIPERTRIEIRVYGCQSSIKPLYEFR